MTHLLDSDWVADWLKGYRTAVQLISSLPPDGLAISIIIYGEVYEGIYFGREPAQHEASFHRFLRGVTVLPITRTIARRFARERGVLRAQGTLIPEPDLLIGATALTHGLILVTRNRRHFERLPQVDYPAMTKRAPTHLCVLRNVLTARAHSPVRHGCSGDSRIRAERSHARRFPSNAGSAA